MRIPVKKCIIFNKCATNINYTSPFVSIHEDSFIPIRKYYNMVYNVIKNNETSETYQFNIIRVFVEK